MRNCLIPTLFLAAVAVTAQPADYAGYKDPALFSRIPGYYLSDEDAFKENTFDALEFRIGEEYKKVEGRHLRYVYRLPEGSTRKPSSLQVLRNYQAAAKKIGGKVLHEEEYRTTLCITKGAQETWVSVETYNDASEYIVEMIERGQMEQEVTANAAAFQSGLKQDGHVEVSGILFDTGKAEIKPESAATLKEVVKLMQEEGTLKLWVVGHTDSSGVTESNVALSAARAAAVVKALTAAGVPAARLLSFGNGPYAPVASNETEEGRAKNRRVELVARP